MPELALHILDLVQNSVSAGATLVVVIIARDTARDTLTITIEDDGKGMAPEFLERVTSPFTTTRTTRKVGLGIPLFKQLTQMCEGDFQLESTVGKGTKLTARLRASHLDLPPLGDLKGTVETLVAACPEKPDFRFVYSVDGEAFVLDTIQVRQALGGLPLGEPEIVSWIGQYFSEGIAQVEASTGA